MGSLNRDKVVSLFAYLSVVALVAGFFNNCSKVGFDASLASKIVDMQSSSMILINQDAQFTNSDQVQVQLQAKNANEAYVTNDPSCQSGGQWEPLVDNKPWQLSGKNQQTSVYAMYRNRDEGVQTGCVSDSIVHDDEKPTVVLPGPGTFTNIEAPVINFVASDSLSGLDEQFCQWPGQAVSKCDFATSNGKLSEGRYLVKVHASDKAGNISDPVAYDLVVDRTGPVISILTAPPATSALTEANYSFNIVDDRSGIAKSECALDSTAGYGPCTNQFIAAVAEGARKFYIRATDRAGNVTEMTHNFVIDLSAPTVTITKSPQDYVNSTSASFEFEGRDGAVPITQFECRLDGQSYVACSSPKSYTGVSEGLRKFEVRGKDEVGNWSAPAVRSWYVDLTKPVVQIVSGPNALTKETSATLRYTATDSGSGVAKVQCALDGAAFADCDASTKDYTGLAEGSHSFKIRAFDKAGNMAESSPYTWLIDLKRPTVSFTQTPLAQSNKKDDQFRFQASDEGGIDRLDCRLDAQAYAACETLTSQTLRDLTEGSHKFFVRAYDRAGNVSDEIQYTWAVDLTAPMISYLQLPPASSYRLNDVKLSFTVTDPLSGVKSLVCYLDGTVTACESGVTKILSGLSTGNHIFRIEVTDNSGNVSSDIKTFALVDPVMKDQLVDVKSFNKVDILVVIDNSGSMAKEQANMAARFSNFISRIGMLDWQIGIISTDVSGDAVRKDGRLVELSGMAGQFILTSSMDPMTAQTVFGNTVQMGTNGSGTELGFKATERAIERSLMTDGANVPNRSLFRSDAGLAVVVVSDAYDDSGRRPEDVINTVKTKLGVDKRFVFHSIVIPESSFTNPNGNAINANDPCKDYRESVKYDGREYHRLSSLTGGIKGNACSEDYSSQLADMGKATAELVNSVTLECAPIDSNGDSKIDNADVQVADAQGANVTGFTVMGDKLNFSMGLPVGSNRIKYYCLQ